MFSTGVYSYFTNQSILTAAVQEGLSEGKFQDARKEGMTGNQRILSGITPTAACNMGFSFWDRHKLSIITDMVIALLIVATCLGVGAYLGVVGYGCHLSSPAIWGITGGSLFVSALCLDATGFAWNITRLSNKIKETLSTRATQDKIKIDGQL